jgi:2-aminoadipate transaminase
MKSHLGRIPYSAQGERARGAETVITRLMGEALADPELLSLAAGFTDNSVLPVVEVQRIVSEMKPVSDREQLQYGINTGRPGLADASVDWLRAYPDEALPGMTRDNVLITNGSQQGLYLLMQALCDPGDIILVEQPTYFVFLELLKGLGVEAISIPSDSKGRIEAPKLAELWDSLEQSGKLSRVKAIYLMGTYANPSTRCLEMESKRALAEFMIEQNWLVPVIEDEAYRDLYFTTPHAVPSLLSLPEWEDLPVVYAGTFTKPFATGLKVGFLASRETGLLTTLARIKGHHDFGTAHFNQGIIETALRSGAYAKHLMRTRSYYESKCRLLESALEENGLKELGWTWESPTGGLLLWVQGPVGLDTRIGSAFHRSCLSSKVLYVPGDLCFAEGTPHHYVRLSFGALPAEKIPEAARRFCEAARRCAHLG